MRRIVRWVLVLVVETTYVLGFERACNWAMAQHRKLTGKDYES